MAVCIRSALSTYVLDAAGPGGAVVVNPQVTMARTQQWTFDDSGCIVNDATGLVLAVGAGDAVVVTSRTTPEDAAQQWDFLADNGIANRSSGLVLTVGGLTSGAAVTVAQSGRPGRPPIWPPIPILTSQLWSLASASTAVSPWFGKAAEYDRGQDPAVALNSSAVVEVHSDQYALDLYYRVGLRVKGTVAWSDSKRYDSGMRPDVDVNDNGAVIEVHEAPIKDGLWCRAGVFDGQSVTWSDSYKFGESGDRPSVALSDGGNIVEVHHTDDEIAYRVSAAGNWPPLPSIGNFLALGSSPSVALNAHDAAVVAYEDPNGTLSYAVGTVKRGSTTVSWAIHATGMSGSAPSVGLTDGGIVVLVYESDGDLFQRTGLLVGTQITWTSVPASFDTGSVPGVACRGDLAVQVHASSDLFGLWFTTSLITDRANWMRDRLPALGNRSLPALTLPAAHDAATGGLIPLAEAQDLTVGGQLFFGVRWFDLRPKWSDGRLIIHHGPIDGMPLQDVLDDIANYLSNVDNELAVFKFSHWDGFDDDAFAALFGAVQDTLGKWLFTTRPPTGKRLADFTLSQFVSDGPCALAVFDTVGEMPPGLWIYRDWDDSDVAEGDLTVYDEFTGTDNFQLMPPDQEQKYADFNGWCKDPDTIPCDLFLFSWTLTPTIQPVSWLADDCDPLLGSELAGLPSPNSHGKAMNMLYVDYVERARVTDVAIWQNGLLG